MTADDDRRVIIAALDFFSVESSLADRLPLQLGDNSSAPIVALANRLRGRGELRARITPEQWAQMPVIDVAGAALLAVERDDRDSAIAYLAAQTQIARALDLPSDHRYYIAHDGVFIDPPDGTTDSDKAIALATIAYDELRGPDEPDPLVTIVIGSEPLCPRCGDGSACGTVASQPDCPIGRGHAAA